MKTKLNLLVAGMFLAATSSALASVHYVWQSSPGPAPPYTNWATAAHVIQDAVDAAVADDEIVVTNGIYATGVRVVYDWMTNRVAVDKPLILRSVNGPQATVIDGGSAVGCVYLTDGATLLGFTLTNGWATDGGGVYCQSTSAVLSNCVLSGNSANGYYDSNGNYVDHTGYGGGANGGTLNNCTLSGNRATCGGGASGFKEWFILLNNCTLTDNSASLNGGGAYCATLNNCMLSRNSAASGGGTSFGELNNCTLTGNSATYGGGAAMATLNNCTLTGNSADGCLDSSGGGVSGSTLTNCIVYFNTAVVEANYSDSSILSYCCTTPEPTNGVGNITADPQLASASHLSAFSPCRGAGSAIYASGTDIDGEAWATPPSIGCDEYHAGAVTGPLSVDAAAAYTNVALGYPIGLTAWIEGRTTLSIWDFGDGMLALDQPCATHTWTAPGDYPVALWAFNESHPEGVSATITVHVMLSPVHYVAPDSLNPVPPYTSWATAATNIQDAVDAAAVGGTVLVTNGTYATGGRAVYGTMINRVAVDKVLAMRSVNGPQFTVIQGYQVPGTTNGNDAIRCVYLTDGAWLVGFTLTNGATRSAGDRDREQSGGGVWCESTNAFVTNCVIAGNSASWYGGGAFAGTLNNCTLTGNCTLTSNSAGQGGGAAGGTLNNCTVTGNSARGGGGVIGATLNNCTVTGNSADWGGGAGYCILNNCIVYFNTAQDRPNYSGRTLNYCCTTPLPDQGEGNISLDPQLASVSHLSAGSPCRGAGSAAYSSGVDVDGEAWASSPSIGCDEYRVGAVTGPLSVAIAASFTNVAVGYPVGLTAWIEARTTLSIWGFGDGMLALNQPYATHAWAAPGDYLVSLWVFNDSHPQGVIGAVTIHVGQGLHYVSADSAHPLPPYTSWATAATNIQDAVDAATVAESWVLVTNGVYATGRRVVGTNVLANRVAVDKPLMVRSVNGPQFTIIQGYQLPGTTNGNGAVRCVYLTNGASLSGFTLTHGATLTNGLLLLEQSGGGVWCESTNAFITNCVIVGNSAGCDGGGAYYGTLNNCTVTGNSARQGGGVFDATLNNCTLTGNSARFNGGGAYYGTLNNCTVTGNSAGQGGGAYYGTLNNCIVYFNSATNGPNYYSGTLRYCCTTPRPGVFWSITNAPLFVDYASGNLRLQSNSPCINAGANAYAVGGTDLDGRPRIVGGTVDMGAYECQSPVLLDYYIWLQSYGLPTIASAVNADSDGDGLNNWQEWHCRTCPTNASSALRLLSPQRTGTNVTVTWQSVAGVSYFLERCTNLAASPPFTCAATNLPGQPGTTSYTDTNAAGLSPLFYRVGVGNYLAPPSPPPPTLTWQYDAGAGTLQLSWSGTGFRLQAQTNSLGVGISTNWFDSPGGTTSPVTVPVDSKNRSVFYRLVWP